MMNRNEFYNYIKENVKEYLPPSFEQAEAALEETLKTNDVKLMGLTVRREGETVAPKIYLDGYFKDYEQGRDVDDIVGEVADIRIENDKSELGDVTSILQNYEEAKKRLQTRICDPNLNAEKLENAVYTMNGDYAVTYHVNLIVENDMTGSAQVTQGMLNQWGVTMDELIADSKLADMNRGAVLTSMDDVIQEMMFGAEAKNLFSEPNQFNATDGMQNPMFVITNPEKQFGAALIVNEDIQNKIAEILQSNYFIIPSSLHECIIVPEGIGISVQELNEMVRDVNATQVEPEDLLSDNVQHFDKESGVMERATLWEEKELAKQATEMSEVKDGESVGKSILERLEAKKEESLQTIADVATLGKAKATENAL